MAQEEATARQKATVHRSLRHQDAVTRVGGLDGSGPSSQAAPPEVDGDPAAREPMTIHRREADKQPAVATTRRHLDRPHADVQFEQETFAWQDHPFQPPISA
jgi:hypothetical protein